MFDGDPLLSIASDACEDEMMIPVDVERGKNEGIEEMLERGFVLNWTASNCSICDSSGGKCGFDSSTYHFMCFCPDRPHAWACYPASEDAGNNKFRMELGLGLGAGIGVLVIILALHIFRRYSKRKLASTNFLSKNSHSDPFSKSEQERGGIFLGVPLFSYTELEEATSNFDGKKELGDGGYGTVYYVNKIQKCEFDELIDPSIGYKSDEEVKRMAIAVAELAFRCLQQDKEMRPSMDEVLEELRRIESAEYRKIQEEIHNDNKHRGICCHHLHHQIGRMLR
ncbi:hypothetical protein GH714_041117 [Hevea brasiliensis]|uniref:Wall-associated receptor kinase C-terminal domain-containing protein n=1 Tax=Hevea brasiliensis TaxID=3981 RepID=A0A6A6N040_HEVBR|nr:hypothetical protein GH714_041117 [Hevea brasiliensis]